MLALGLCTALAASAPRNYPISGTVQITSLPDNEPIILVLTGDTTLEINNTAVHKSIVAIRGSSYSLTIQGNGSATVIRNEYDDEPAILAKNLTIDVHELDVYSKGSGILLRGTDSEDNLSIKCDRLTVIAQNGDAVNLQGTASIERDASKTYYNGNINIEGSRYGLCANRISIGGGNVYFSGGISACYARIPNGLTYSMDDVALSLPSGGYVEATGHQVFNTSGYVATNVAFRSGAGDVPVYTVSFDMQGHSEAQVITQHPWHNNDVILPTTLSLPGYELAGWTRTLGMSDQWHTEDRITEDVVMYARWKDYGTGSLGGSVTWELDSTYLEVRGEGAMDKYDPSYDLTDAIKEKVEVLRIWNGVTNIEQDMFRNCKNLKEIILFDVTDIGEAAFLGCTSLATVNIPKNCTVHRAAFRGCTALEVLRLPDGSTVEDQAFMDCSSLWILQFPAWLRIGDSAFANCTSLEKVLLPKYCDAVSASAFTGNPSMYLYCRTDEPEALEYAQINGYNHKVADTLLLPAGLRTIESQAFANLSKPMIVAPQECYCTVAADAFENSDIILMFELSGADFGDWARAQHMVFWTDQ